MCESNRASSKDESHQISQTSTVTIWQEDNWYVAQCLEVDIASQGRTEAEALKNLQEAIELHFEPPVPTL